MANKKRRTVLLVGIVDKPLVDEYVGTVNSLCVAYHFSGLGFGTAPKTYRNFFGFEEIEKRVVCSLVPSTSVHAVMSGLNRDLKLYLPGQGVAFSVPLTGVSSLVSEAVLSTPEVKEKDTASRKKSKKETIMRELVVAVVHQKYADIAVDAARAAGATGCTVMHTKSQGNEVVGARIGTSFREDTDTLTFLTDSNQKAAIMAAVRDAAGLKTDGGAVIFSLPVDEIVGIGRFEE